MNPLVRKLLSLICLGAAIGAAQGQEARQFSRIATPGASPAGARILKQSRPISKAKVEEAIGVIAAAWNTPKLEANLADNFYGKSRLTDALSTGVPRDAKLRVTSIQGIQILGQYVRQGTSGEEEVLSRVSVVVRTQIEYNDPRQGFQSLSGTNEFIVLIAEPST
jgi:hypothetical protein